MVKMGMFQGQGLQVIPEELASAAEDIGNIGTRLEEAHAIAALPTSGIVPAGADEVSAAIAPLFNSYSTTFQEAAAQGAAFHLRFTQLLGAAAS
jgi:hypothetical protein